MAVALGRPQSVCATSGGGGGAAKRSACEAWFALNRRAYQAVLNMAIQAEMNMTSAEVTSSRRRHARPDDVTSGQEPAAESTTPVDNGSTLSTLIVFKSYFRVSRSGIFLHL